MFDEYPAAEYNNWPESFRKHTQWGFKYAKILLFHVALMALLVREM